jgi:poly-gamma-glutamate synthesis protein (capsule biosynthesis protein)
MKSEEDERYTPRKREELRQKREQEVRKQKKILCCVVIALVLIGIGVIIWRNLRQKAVEVSGKENAVQTVETNEAVDQQNESPEAESSEEDRQIYQREGKTEDTAEIVIAGDLCFAEDGFVLDHYDEVGSLPQCISQEILDITNAADIFYINHEFCTSEQGEPLEGKLYTFRANPERNTLLEEMGTDIVSLANNHVYDYGASAFLDTLDYLDAANIPYVGGGRNKEEANRPVYFDVGGIRIGFVAATNAELTLYTPAATEDSPGVLEAYDTTEYNQVIAKAAAQCDFLIAYIHWGTEDVNWHTEEQTEQGRQFLAAGADIVVGGHPHVLQGIEYVDEKPIVYSLGDFWFNDETKYTGLLKLNIMKDGLKEMSFVPCLQTGYTTQYISDAQGQRELYDYLQGLSPNIIVNDVGVILKQ